MRFHHDPVHGAILIVLLVISIAACGCTGSSPAPSPATTQTQVSGASMINIQNFAFVPASITVPKGTTVTWVNEDATDHQIGSDAAGQGAFGSGILSKGSTYSFTFSTPGTYPYHCMIHPSMKGTVIVQ